MKRLPVKRMLIANAFAFLSIISTPAQIGNGGKLEQWTTVSRSREHTSSELIYVKNVRDAKQKDFDRVVFEFEKQIPNYRIEYLKSHFYEGEAERVRIKSAG